MTGSFLMLGCQLLIVIMPLLSVFLERLTFNNIKSALIKLISESRTNRNMLIRRIIGLPYAWLLPAFGYKWNRIGILIDIYRQ